MVDDVSLVNIENSNKLVESKEDTYLKIANMLTNEIQSGKYQPNSRFYLDDFFNDSQSPEYQSSFRRVVNHLANKKEQFEIPFFVNLNKSKVEVFLSKVEKDVYSLRPLSWINHK